MMPETEKEKKPKSKKTAILLSAIPYTGIFGIDRFYMGYWGLGVLKFITAGGGLIWYIIDIILIATGKLKCKDGTPLAAHSDKPGRMKDPADIIRNSPSAQERYAALDVVKSRTESAKDFYSGERLNQVRRKAVELYQYTALHDTDSKNRDHAVSLTNCYGDTEDVQYLFDRSSDPKLKARLFRILAGHFLSAMDDTLKYSKAECSAAEGALCTLMRSYFRDSESGSAGEKLMDCLNGSWLNEYEYETFRNIFLYKANIGSISENDAAGLFIRAALQKGDRRSICFYDAESLLNYPDLSADEIGQLRGKLAEAEEPVRVLRLLASSKVPEAEQLLQLRMLDSLTAEQARLLSELPEDMIKALLLKGSFSDACITALHDAPKWTEFVEQNVSRTRTYSTYETVHDEIEDRFYDEEWEHVIERW